MFLTTDSANCEPASADMARQPLTAYLLSKRVGSLDAAGPAIRDLETEVPVPDRDVFRARLFVSKSHPAPPPWAAYVQQAVNVPLEFPENSAIGAVLLVEAKTPRDETRIVAFTFGVAGQPLLRRGWYEHGFGLRCALNACFPRNLPISALTSLRSIDSKAFDDVALDTRQLASRQVDFDVFGMNIQTDLLRAILGRPADETKWGARVSGKDSFVFSAFPTAPLSRVARDLLEIHDATDYKKHFPWVDNIKPVRDETLRLRLEEAVVDAAKGDRLDLTGPEELDSRDVRYYRLRGDRRINQRYALELRIYLTHIGGKEEVTIQRLRSDWIKSYNDAGQVLDEKSVFDCLAGDLVVDGSTYVVADGEFYEVDRNFMRILDRDIRSIPTYPGLPASELDEAEGAYNERVAGASPDLALLDKKNLTLRGRTTPVEPCDLLSRHGALIHVKRHVRSSLLSHLFSQGAVSGELLVTNEVFRAELRQLVETVERARFLRDPAYEIGVYECVTEEPPERFAHEVVFGIITRWNGRAPVDALPFFSKLNLRQRAEELNRLGLKTSIAMIKHP
jgi:uncharacterized protein (TIGR04141 family)